MPLIATFHTAYWEHSDTVTVAVGRMIGHYPAWQTAAVTLGTLFGGVLPFWERFWDRVAWWWKAQPRCARLDREQRQVLLKTLDALEHPAYPLARLSVRKTATTLGFNRPEAWKELSRELKGSACHAENAFRHLEACRLVRANLVSSTLTNPECNLLVELAYQGFAARST